MWMVSCFEPLEEGNIAACFLLVKPAMLYSVKGSYRKVAWSAEHLAFFVIVLSASPGHPHSMITCPSV